MSGKGRLKTSRKKGISDGSYKKTQGTNTTGSADGLNEKKWGFFVTDDTSSSGSSIPVDLDLVDGEIEIVQSNKTLSDSDKITAGTALHKIIISDPDRKRMGKCSSVSTDWALELESSFLKGSQLLIRKVSPGSTFSHRYDNPGAFDRVAIRAHFTAKKGGTVFEGYFCRRQELTNPLRQTAALKKLESDRMKRSGNTLLKKLSNPGRNNSIPENEELNAGGDVLEADAPYHPESSFRKGTASHRNSNISSEGIPGVLTFPSVNNDELRREKGSKKFNESSSVQAESNHQIGREPSGSRQRETPKVGFPDPQSVPKAVVNVNDFDDVLANRKVIDYLNHLEEGAGIIDGRLDNGEEVSQDDIDSLNSAASSILREYGYDIPPKITPVKKRVKLRNPEGDSETSSDVSDTELKSEVIKRAVEGRDFSGLLGLLENSKEWKESFKGDRASSKDQLGKIERAINLRRS